MTDNGLAALAEALTDLFPAVQRDWWPFTPEQAAAAILRNGAVFLPEGLGPVMVGMAKEIAALRAALAAIEIEHRADDHPEWAGWYGEEGERPDLACRTCGTFDEYAVHWPCDTAKIAHAALAASGESDEPSP